MRNTFKEYIIESKTMAKKAQALASFAHEGQYRKNKDSKGYKIPYRKHPEQVAELVRKIKNSHKIEELVSAAYLHDVVEDTDITITTIKREFGQIVAGLVQELTNDEALIKKIGKTKALTEKMLTMSSWGLVIKLADRVANTSDLKDASPEFRKKYTNSTYKILKVLTANRQLSDTQKKLVKMIYKNLKTELKEL